MGRLSGRWMGIGIAVLVVGALALYSSNAGPRPTPAAGPATPLLAPTQAARAEGAQPLPGMSAKGMAGLVVKLGIVALVMGGSLWLLKRFAVKTSAGSGRTGAISIADTIPLAQGRAVYVLDAGDRALVVGATPQQLSLLAELTDGALLEKLRAPARAAAMPSLGELSQRVSAAVHGFSGREQPGAPPRTRRERTELTVGSPSPAALDDAATPNFADTLAAHRSPAAVPARMSAVERVGDSSERLRALAARLREARDTA